MDTTHKLKKETFLHDLVAIYSGGDAFDKAGVDMIGMNHHPQFLVFLIGEGRNEFCCVGVILKCGLPTL